MTNGSSVPSGSYIKSTVVKSSSTRGAMGTRDYKSGTTYRYVTTAGNTVYGVWTPPETSINDMMRFTQTRTNTRTDSIRSNKYQKYASGRQVYIGYAGTRTEVVRTSESRNAWGAGGGCPRRGGRRYICDFQNDF
jgi:hypothetical protein